MTENTASVVEQDVQQPNPAENTFKPEDIERIKQETAHKSFKSGYEQARKELEKQKAVNSVETQAPVNNQTMDFTAPQYNPQPDANQTPDIQSLIAQEFQRREQQMQQQQQEEQGRQILNSIAQKAENAKQEIPDFDEVTSQINWANVPDVLRFANEFDNTGHVLYHLAKNPAHLGDIMNLVNYGQGNAAFSHMKRLSDSLRINKDAQDQQMPSEPLSRLETSAVGVGNGKMGVKDYKAKYRV